SGWIPFVTQLTETTIRKIAQLPDQRKLWQLRKIYAGNGGILPPTDERILRLTPEQIALEFEHLKLDKEENGEGAYYTDDAYEEYDKQTDEEDSNVYFEDKEASSLS